MSQLIATIETTESPLCHRSSPRSIAVLSRLSAKTNDAAADPHEAERLYFANYGTTASEYKPYLCELYSCWALFNDRFFQSRLLPPHFIVGRTATRALAHCQRISDWGAKLQIGINRGLFDGSAQLIINSWPAEGTRRFVHDVVLHEAVHQYQLEIAAKPEAGYRGHGPGFAEQCNRIGHELGLPPVGFRSPRGGQPKLPPCNQWPINVRPLGYYGGDVAVEKWFRTVDIGDDRHDEEAPTEATIAGDDLLPLFQLLNYFTTGNRWSDLQSLLDRRLVVRSLPAFTTQCQRDQAIKNVCIDPQCLEWNDRCIPRLACLLYRHRFLGSLSIIGDALEAAGCTDPIVLDHCRKPQVHSQSCALLRCLSKHVT